MTREDYDTLDGVFKDAETSETPFLVASDDELKVVGDANKTEIHTHDFEISFRLPPEEKGGSYRVVTKKFENVYITPRQDTKILKALTTMLPYFRSVSQNGQVGELSEDEKYDILGGIDDSMYDAMYDMVSTILGIDAELRDYMLPSSVLRATIQFVRAFPETFNEADVFFG